MILPARASLTSRPLPGKRSRSASGWSVDLLNGPPDATPLGWWVRRTFASAPTIFARSPRRGAPRLRSTSRPPDGGYCLSHRRFFTTTDGPATGPYSNTRCVTVAEAVIPCRRRRRRPLRHPHQRRPRRQLRTHTITGRRRPRPARRQRRPCTGLHHAVSASSYPATEVCVAAAVTITRTGSTSSAATVDYVAVTAPPVRRTNRIRRGRLTFAAGQTSKNVNILITAMATRSRSRRRRRLFAHRRCRARSTKHRHTGDQ